MNRKDEKNSLKALPTLEMYRKPRRILSDGE